MKLSFTYYSFCQKVCPNRGNNKWNFSHASHTNSKRLWKHSWRNKIHKFWDWTDKYGDLYGDLWAHEKGEHFTERRIEHPRVKEKVGQVAEGVQERGDEY